MFFFLFFHRCLLCITSCDLPGAGHFRADSSSYCLKPTIRIGLITRTKQIPKAFSSSPPLPPPPSPKILSCYILSPQAKHPIWFFRLILYRHQLCFPQSLLYTGVRCTCCWSSLRRVTSGHQVSWGMASFCRMLSNFRVQECKLNKAGNQG